MFDSIQKGLSDALRKMRGRGRLTADNIREGLREVRRALLEADVNFTVVTQFIARVEERSVGQDVLARVDPSEQIVKIVYDELVALMGPVDSKILLRQRSPDHLDDVRPPRGGQDDHHRQTRLDPARVGSPTVARGG